MMHWMGGGAGWMVIGLVLWVAVIGAAVWGSVWLIHRTRPSRPLSPPSPLDILERRFAAGEITREDFDEARARLREHELDI
ncbi:putative membrane protein [Kribbella sp. VKM Ac-2571]|uniref:SHOCT domain-containing protein n=1 Tax=Kribbella sp. VKM Ac-2571 TaxID=2512222 RepID=UPI00105F53EA|nr:SHOCT domain-containing protein [Kribbella sp. VKM Ac-2571]TDO58769.1 putative membrane protein [Kribbella sp. VKM Ac-2571]